MILDDNLVFTNGDVCTGTSVPVDLEQFHNPSKVDKLWIVACTSGDFAGVTALSFTVQQADKPSGDFEDVEGLTISMTQDMLVGMTPKFYFPLPPVTKQWIRLNYTATGTRTAGGFFAALTPFREIPYCPGEFIDAGQVKG